MMAIKVTAKPKVVMFNQMNWQLMPPTGSNRSPLISPSKQFKINSTMPQFNCSTNLPVRKLTIKEVKTIPKPTKTTENSIPSRESTKTAGKIVTISKDNKETRTYSVSDTPSVPTLVERPAQNSRTEQQHSSTPCDEEDDDDSDLFHDSQEGGLNIVDADNDVDQLSHDHIIRTIYLCCPLPDCELTIPFRHTANTINTKELIDAHMRQEHGCSRMPSICLDCKRPYPAGQLDDHLAQHHSCTARGFKCRECGATFNTYDNLAGHNHLAHVKGRFECAKCHCTFFAPYRIEVYQHNQAEHWHRCYFAGCGKTYELRSRMKCHNMQHLGVNLFRCDWPDCTDFAGANTWALVVKHIREKHTDGQIRAVLNPNLFVKQVTFLEAMQSAGKFDFEI